MQLGKVLGVWTIVGAVSLLVGGCATETDGGEDVQGGSEEAAGQGGEETGSVSQAAITCASGFHHHTIDWGTAGLYPWGSCSPNGTNLPYGHEVCQKDGGPDYSCDNDGMVYVATRVHGVWKYGGVKMCALNGHC